MPPRDLAESALLDNGYRLERHGNNHDIYYNPVRKKGNQTKSERNQNKEDL